MGTPQLIRMPVKYMVALAGDAGTMLFFLRKIGVGGGDGNQRNTSMSHLPPLRPRLTTST